MSLRLTDKTVAALPVPEKGNRKYRDRDLTGFACQVTSTGHRAFVLIYRIGGAERLFTIGETGVWSAAAARTEAARLRRLVDQGFDPKSERDEERTAPTVADLARRYEEEHLPSKRARSADEDRALINGYILPALGKMKVADVRQADVTRMHREITKAGKPYRANRALACASTMFGLAVRLGWRADNPCKGIKKNPEDHRERFLSPAEIARLAEVLDGHPERTTVALIRFLMMTGCRFSEAATATWSQFDLERGVWTKPSAHTKQKKLHAVPLSVPALALLSSLKRNDDNPLVFPSPKTRRSLVTIKTAWARICRDAKIKGVRLHDLRHGFASMLASGGASLPLIGSLLGHTQVATTARYAHLADDARREAVERVGAVLSGGQTGEVVRLPGRIAR